MIFRLILLFLIIWFLFWIIKKQFLGSSTSADQQIPDNSEDIIPCCRCGTHVPSSLGVRKEGKFYCSQQHAELEESGLDDE